MKYRTGTERKIRPSVAPARHGGADVKTAARI
jgi:hypothetical protein